MQKPLTKDELVALAKWINPLYRRFERVRARLGDRGGQQMHPDLYVQLTQAVWAIRLVETSASRLAGVEPGPLMFLPLVEAHDPAFIGPPRRLSDRSAATSSVSPRDRA